MTPDRTTQDTSSRGILSISNTLLEHLSAHGIQTFSKMANFYTNKIRVIWKKLGPFNAISCLPLVHNLELVIQYHQEVTHRLTVCQAHLKSGVRHHVHATFKWSPAGLCTVPYTLQPIHGRHATTTISYADHVNRLQPHQSDHLLPTNTTLPRLSRIASHKMGQSGPNQVHCHAADW